jgi:hypothetical protein
MEAMTQKLATLRAEYECAGRPLLDRIGELSVKIMDLKRDRGELFYVEYMRYGSQCIEEFGTLHEAKVFACYTADYGKGSVACVRGPGVYLEDWEWEDD